MLIRRVSKTTNSLLDPNCDKVFDFILEKTKATKDKLRRKDYSNDEVKVFQFPSETLSWHFFYEPISVQSLYLAKIYKSVKVLSLQLEFEPCKCQLNRS